MYTSHNPCWDAKNRYGLADEVPFSYEAIRHIIEQRQEGGLAGDVKQPDSHTPVPEERPKSQKQPQASSEHARQGAGEAANADGRAADPAQPPADGQGPRDTPTELPGHEGAAAWEPDRRIPKALRDLMIANNVNEWDIQNVCEVKGYFPGDMPIWEYPRDFIEGCLVGAWSQVHGAIQEMKAKEAIPFN